MSIKHASGGKSKNTKDGSAMTDEEAFEKEPNGSFAWKVLVPSQVRALSQCETPHELEEKMASILEFDESKVELTQACQLDCYVIAFHWAKDKCFDERQLSGFITLVSNILNNIKEHQMSKAENITYLKECFSGVGSENPDVVSIPLYFFKLEHAKLIMQYLLTTIFQHYKLYEYLFTQQQDELIIGSDLCTEVCPEMSGPFPPPLQEAIPVETYELFAVQKDTEKLGSVDAMDEATITEQIADSVLKAVESSESEIVKTVPTSDLRKIIENITKEMVLPAKAEIQNKIKGKEATYLARISKIQAK
ncbi:ciliary-associated calcium-binding coiled-coil protein 1-like isoform X2 [Clavelina lepadiformis]|uniref:Ciliary-associated calcium-binding coiled-coil protein 1 n=1 Tax=Clavelina lepadiformis TaxID=159417 RepID=A0ABP0EZA3_CLALP